MIYSSFEIPEPLRLFYSCSFKKIKNMGPVGGSYQVFYHRTLHELGELDPSCTFSTSEPVSTSDILIKAFIKKAVGHFQCAENLYLRLGEISETAQHFFQSILGLCHIYYAQSRCEEIREAIKKLEELKDVIDISQKMEFSLLEARVAIGVDKDYAKGERICLSLISEAQRYGWEYFRLQGYYLLYLMAKEQNAKEPTRIYYQLLKSYLAELQWLRMQCLLEAEEKQTADLLGADIYFDDERMRIYLKGQWLQLNQKPKIYQFLRLVSSEARFFCKEDVAECLWPSAEYSAKAHDPRIFDIVRRSRRILNPFGGHTYYIMSNRMGYRFVGNNLVHAD